MAEINENYNDETTLDQFYLIIKENIARLAEQVGENEQNIANTKVIIAQSDVGELSIKMFEAENNIENIKTVLEVLAPKTSPQLNGIPTAPTAAIGTSSTQIATTEFVNTAMGNNVVIGTYTGDGSEARQINLGFRPDVVEVYVLDKINIEKKLDSVVPTEIISDTNTNNFKVDDIWYNKETGHDGSRTTAYGGFALGDESIVENEYTAGGVSAYATSKIISLKSNGFEIYNKTSYNYNHYYDTSNNLIVSYAQAATNESGQVYYFKAYRNAETMILEEVQS